MNDLVPVVEGQIVEYEPDYDEIWRGLMSEISYNTAIIYEPIIKDFIQWWQHSPDQPAAVALATYLHDQKEQGMAHSTLNKKRSALRRWFEWAAALDYISHEDLLKVKQVKGFKIRGSKRGKWLNVEQMQNVFDQPLERDDILPLQVKRDRAILAMLMGCGMRRSEPVELRWKQLEPYGDKYAFVNVSRKAHRTQPFIPVATWVHDVLMDLKEAMEPEEDDRILTAIYVDGSTSDSLTDQQVYNLVKHYAKMAGFDISPHDLRRSYAREARANGAEISQIQLVLGHADQATTEKYVNEMMDVEQAAEFVKLDV